MYKSLSNIQHRTLFCEYNTGSKLSWLLGSKDVFRIVVRVFSFSLAFQLFDHNASRRTLLKNCVVCDFYESSAKEDRPASPPKHFLYTYHGAATMCIVLIFAMPSRLGTRRMLHRDLSSLLNVWEGR